MHKSKFWNPSQQKFVGADNAEPEAIELWCSDIRDIHGQEMYEGDLVDCGWAIGEVRLGWFDIEFEDVMENVEVARVNGWHVHFHKQGVDAELDDNAQVIGNRYTHLPDGTRLP